MRRFRELVGVATAGLTARKVRTLLIMLGPILAMPLVWWAFADPARTKRQLGVIVVFRLCGGRTVHTCENCKGRGRFIPTMLDARVSRDPETELEEIGLQ